MADVEPRGPAVPSDESLLRGIRVPEWWDQQDEYVSPAIFGFPKFSSDIESMTTQDAALGRLPDGSGILRFNSGVARQLQFDAHHEPELGNDAHANVYRTRRKKQARRLLDSESTMVIVKPDIEKLRASG